MRTDLLTIKDYEPPMGDTAGRGPLATCRAIWATRLENETDAPDHRIIHALVWQGHAPAVLHRLGVRPAQGYHKCGSTVDNDWVTSFRVRAWLDGRWQDVLQKNDVDRTNDGEVEWYDLGGVSSAAVIVEVRRCGIDEWWPSWNLTSGAFVLEGELSEPLKSRDESLLEVGEISLSGLPDGLAANHFGGEVRYTSDHLDIGFCLNRAGWSFMGVDAEGVNPSVTNLLKHGPGLFFQGPQLHPVGQAPVAMPALRNQVHGTTRVHGNRVTYDLALGETGTHYRLAWEVLPDRLILRAERKSEREIRAWKSSAWTLAMDSTASPAHMIGKISRNGETGLLDAPAWLHIPGFGSFKVGSKEDVLLRSDAVRPIDMTLTEVKLGEVPQPEGDYLLPEGSYRARLEFRLDNPDVVLSESTPAEVQDAVDRCALTALTYRADTATLSNNGASMHCPICMDNWSVTTTRLGQILPDVHANDLLRDSLERWLDGGPGYTSGGILQQGKRHDAEDEYLMTGTACLLGLSDFLESAGTPDWVSRYSRQISTQLEKMRARDLDDDGIVESPYRTGVSGTGQWSTCWFDVISYGWKDALSNALLYQALVGLSTVLPALNAPALATGLQDWADKLRANYTAAFLNPETGWLAGWRCKEDRLHDYAFLTPNGAAVVSGVLDDELARDIMKKLWEESLRVNMPDPYYGLPGNLWPIPDEDMSDIIQGYPMGFYQNGGRTHSQSRHFVGALYKVGMEREADYLLSRLCKGLADGDVYGGSRSGRDWRYWDGRPCGYEGLLTDQFGILGVALERYGSTS